MGGYGVFAEFYDRLTTDVAYGPWADYLLSLFEKHGRGRPETLLDLACGSGSLSLELASRGVDVIGVDGSEDMLSLAMAKAARGDLELMFLEQDMRELDLFGTVSGAVCLLDSLNHITNTAGLAEVFRRLGLFIEPGGLLVFDANTPYKHREILGDNAFVFEEEDFLCVWRNRFIGRTCEVEMTLDFFAEEGGLYERMTDVVRERAYSLSTWERLLKEADFELLAVYGERTEEPPTEDASAGCWWRLTARPITKRAFRRKKTKNGCNQLEKDCIHYE